MFLEHQQTQQSAPLFLSSNQNSGGIKRAKNYKNLDSGQNIVNCNLSQVLNSTNSKTLTRQQINASKQSYHQAKLMLMNNYSSKDYQSAHNSNKKKPSTSNSLNGVINLNSKNYAFQSNKNSQKFQNLMGQMTQQEILMADQVISSFNNNDTKNNEHSNQFNKFKKKTENEILASSNYSAHGNLERISQNIQNSFNLNLAQQSNRKSSKSFKYQNRARKIVNNLNARIKRYSDAISYENKIQAFENEDLNKKQMKNEMQYGQLQGNRVLNKSPSLQEKKIKYMHPIQSSQQMTMMNTPEHFHRLYNNQTVNELTNSLRTSQMKQNINLTVNNNYNINELTNNYFGNNYYINQSNLKSKQKSNISSRQPKIEGIHQNQYIPYENQLNKKLFNTTNVNKFESQMGQNSGTTDVNPDTFEVAETTTNIESLTNLNVLNQGQTKEYANQVQGNQQINRFSVENLKSMKESYLYHTRGDIIARSLQIKRNSQMEKNKAKAIYESKIYHPLSKSNKSNFNVVYTNRKNKHSLAPKTNLEICKDQQYQNGETRIPRSYSANPSKEKNKNQIYLNDTKQYQSIGQSIVTTVQYKPSKATQGQQGNSAKSLTYKSQRNKNSQLEMEMYPENAAQSEIDDGQIHDQTIPQDKKSYRIVRSSTGTNRVQQQIPPASSNKQFSQSPKIQKNLRGSALFNNIYENLQFTANNPLNNSLSKQMYSFSKSPRKSINFQMREIYCDNYYDLPSSVSMTQMNHKKTPSFGIGAKQSDLKMRKDLQNMPGPNHYDIASQFDLNKSNSKGKTFGVSHEAYQKVYNKALPEKKGWTEPGMYTIKSFVDIANESKRKIVIGQKISVSPSKDNQIGPGQYNDNEIEGINKIGKYFNTKHESSKAQNFSKGKRKAFVDVKNSNPGPGTYDDGLEIQKQINPINNQQFPISDYRNVKTSNFGKYSERFQDFDVDQSVHLKSIKSFSKRMGSTEQSMKQVNTMRIQNVRKSRQVPGPGTYDIISEFGTYSKDKKWNKINFQLSKMNVNSEQNSQIRIQIQDQKQMQQSKKQQIRSPVSQQQQRPYLAMSNNVNQINEQMVSDEIQDFIESESYQQSPNNR